MGIFRSSVITAKGQALMAKVIADTATLSFTKIAVSDTDNSEADLASLTTIGTIRQYGAVASVTRQNDTYVKVSIAFENSELAQGYYVRSIGLYATDPDDGEILYSIVIADETTVTADYMPPFNGIGSSSLLVDLVTAIGNASNVNVEVDPTAMATVAQITELHDEIEDVRTFVGYDIEGVYGVEVDFANNQFTRLAGATELTEGEDFDELTPWGGRRRCNVADDGTVNAYYEDDTYKEDGSNGQVMVEQPVFYVKTVPISTKTATSGKGKEILKARYYISPVPRVGFTAPEAFKDDKGVVQDKIYLSAYEGCLYDNSASAYITNDSQVMDAAADKLSSIANAKPASGSTQQLTRANVRKLCNNRGTGWQSSNIFSVSVTEYLFLVEYASFDCQTKIGRGVCDKTDDGSTNMAENTGATASLGNGSGKASGTDGLCSVSYRGEENLWGNIWTWLDKINVLAKGANEAYLFKAGATVADDTVSGYKNYGTQLSHKSGYQSALGYSDEYPDLFMPTAADGEEHNPIGSYVYQNYTYNGFLISEFGGKWSNGSECGWCLNVSHASSDRYRYVGGRLLYVPQTKVS